MYAVFKVGGEQVRASVGDMVEVEKLAGNVGDSVEFPEVLLLSSDKTVVGTPSVKGAKVIGEIVKHGRANTILVMKFKRRKTYRRKVGHRQHFTTLKITQVVAP
jgi:large subunit ribosomal protein L21